MRIAAVDELPQGHAADAQWLASAACRCTLSLTRPGRELQLTRWDFAADLTELLTLVNQGRGPRTMSEMLTAASAVVDASQTGPTQLRDWFDANAEMLIGQQLLVASVHSQQSPETELPRLLREWIRDAEDPSPDDAVEWLKQEYPGLLRAWLLTRVADLIAAEMDRQEAGDQSTDR